MGAAKHRTLTPAILPLDQARAAREAAEHDLAAARAAVQVEVDRWPAPSNDRRWLSEMFTAPRPANDYMLDPDGRAKLERLADFKRAVGAEKEAERKLDVAVKAEAEAIRLAFGNGRGALADAFVAARARVAEANAVRATAERARGTLVKAQMADDAAQAALTAAKEAAIDAASRADGATPANLKELRRAAADAADDVEIAAEAVARADAAVVDPEYEERRAREGIEAAARAVLAADASQRLAALEAMVAEFQARAITAAAYLAEAAPRSFSYGSEEARVRMFADARLQELIHLGRPDPSAHYAQQRAGLDLHASTLAALMLDAAAPIPELPA